ncbi:hypothetical protein DSM03_102333 [Leeuwenhoekiella aestuarii]|uniref:Uncharacterized protein n=1 Tax=Leeuwenhoekiella aestuarii TaxID=2249426 RepID=A0A4Q0NVW2_9FLAO|nr:hypothetical protein [Leeuwenhoekiella aestuarii]RXG15436.1 hypothetical protein DSM04_103325 [Leeuwenhoekiella aestuarii]RXG17457.1 hypothetical protein DSM03_102333 [Leeuwenhoekiella aestuarii]
MSSLKKMKYSKQLIGTSLVWLTGMGMITFAIVNSSSIEQLAQLKYIPVYTVIILSSLCLGLCHYLYWQDYKT